MRILFMGTPDFAAGVLNALIDAKHEICAVVTRADKPSGRGHKLAPPPVKVLAAEHGIPVCQPETLKDGAIAPLLEQTRPELIAVAAYGRLLPPYVLDFPRYGCINVHASLLPAFRGASPINRAIMEGAAVTGVTTMFMARGLDTGDMLLSEQTPITDADTFGTLHDRLRDIGARLLVKTIEGLEAGAITPQKQNDELASYAPMISKDDCAISFNAPARAVFNFIRGLSPAPAAYTALGGTKLKVFGAETVPGVSGAPGKVIYADRTHGLVVAALDGGVRLTDILPAGKKRMSDLEYLAGHPVAPGTAAE